MNLEETELYLKLKNSFDSGSSSEEKGTVALYKKSWDGHISVKHGGGENICEEAECGGSLLIWKG